MKPIQSTTHLEQQLSANDLYEEVLQQACKDLGSFAPFPGTIPDLPDAQWLISFCADQFYKLSQYHHEQMLQLLYRTDVRERQFTEVLQNTEWSEKVKAEKIALLFLNRELMKVLTRRAHKKG